MKLHLPKTLLVAVLAACVAPTWAGQWVVDDSNQYYDCYQFTGTDDATSLNLKEVYTVNGEDYSHIKEGVTWIRAGESSLTTPVSISTTLTEVEMGAGNKLIISGTWNNENHAFKALTIEALKITDNTGAYGAGKLVIAEDSNKVLADQSVTIGSIYGGLSELKVDSHGTLKLNGLRYISGKNENNENVWADTFSSGSSVSIEGVLDLTGITFENGTPGDNQAVVKLMNVATGTGTIKLASGAQIQTAGNRDAVTLSTNYVVDGGSDAELVLTSWKKDNGGWRTWTVTTNGSLTVGDGAGKLNIRAGQELVLDGGDVTAGELYLGHTSSGNPGKLTMNNAQSQLTVSSILGLCGNDNSGFNNEVEITAGTLKVTGANALGLATVDFAEKNTVSSPILNATIGGSGENGVLLQTGSTDVAFKGDSTTLGGGKLTIGNITIDATNTNRITITDAVLNGKITNAGGADKLTIGGNFTIGTITDLAEKEAVSGFVLDSNDLTTTNDLQNGFIVASGSYWLVEGKTTLEDGTTLTNEAGDVAYTLTSDDSGIYTTIATSIDKSKYYVTSGDVAVSSTLGADSYVVRGGTMNISGTINASDIEYTSGAITLADAKSVLVLDNATNAATLLSLTTGELGTIKVTTNTTMSGAAQAKGKLIVEGVTLTVEPSGSSVNKIENTILSSFTSIDLNGATVRYHGSTTTWQNVTVGTTGATLKIKDMDSNNNAKDLSLAGTTTLNGDFTIESSWENNAQTWKYGVNIAALTGSGDLTIKGTTHGSSGGEQNRVRAKLLSTYTGTITAEQSSNNTSVTQVYLSADGNINLTGLNIKGGATVDLSGVTGTKNLGAVVIDGSSSLSLTGQLGNMAASGAGALTLAAGISTSGTVSIANALTIGGTIANTGSFTLSGNVTIADIHALKNNTIYSDNEGKDGYISSAIYYVVESSGSGSATASEGLLLNGTHTLTAENGNLVARVENETPGGIYYVNTRDFTVDGTDTNAAKDATGYKIAAGKTLTISAAQSESMTAGKILSEATGEGNIELNTNASYSGGVASQAEGKLTINKGVTLSVGDGSDDSSNISSFSSVDLKGGALSLNGASSEVKSLTVSEAKGTLTVKNAYSGHRTYTLSGTTTLNADLDITSPKEHGDVIVKNLTGSKNLSIVGGNADWGGIMVRLEKLTDYTGSITVDNEGRAASPSGPKYTNIEFGTSGGDAAFSTLKGLEIKGNAYALVHAKGESTIESLTLANGTLNVLNLKTNASDADGHQTTNITSLSIDKTGTLGTTRSNSCYHGTINVKSLSHTGDSAVLTLMNGSQIDNATIFNINGGAFKGTINLEANSAKGDGTPNRKLHAYLNNESVAQAAVINFQDPSTDTNTDNAYNYITLGVGADTVKVGGLTGTTTNAATIKSTGNSGTRTLEINTTQGADYSTNAKVEASVNLVKSGEGTQTFTGTVASSSVSVLGGGLSLTGIETLQLQDLVVKSGATLSVGANNNGVVMVGSPVAPASTTVSTPSAKLEGGATIEGSLNLSNATSLTLDGVGSNAVKIGGDLTLATGSLTLSGDVLNALAEIEVGQRLTIMTIGESLIVDGQVITESITADSVGYSLAEVFTNEGYDDFYLGFDYVPADEADYSTVYIGKIVPEPTTATLSLLALAALAARRRRR